MLIFGGITHILIFAFVCNLFKYFGVCSGMHFTYLETTWPFQVLKPLLGQVLE